MLRGITKFTCDDCGNKFMALDMEWNATVFTAPARCPKCGSMHTYPSDCLAGKSLFIERYGKAWMIGIKQISDL